MKAVAADKDGLIRIVDIPMPQYNEYECLVKIKACGICNSTDFKLIKNQLGEFPVEYPTLLGHESAGEVIALGNKVRNFKIGDRVVTPYGRLEPGTPYHSTWAEMSEYGIAHDIRAMQEDGVSLPEEIEIESFEDYRVNSIPEGISFVDAAVLLTVKENYSALKNFGMAPGKSVFIFGDGPVALGLSSIAKVMGASFIGCAGHHDDRLEIIKSKAQVDLAVNTNKTSIADVVKERKFDLIIDAIGSVGVIRDGRDMIKTGGKFCMYGVLKKDGASINLLSLPNHTNVHILNDPYGEYRSHNEVCELVTAGKINLKDFYSHVLPLDKAAEGFELIKTREAFKVMLTMD